MEEFASTVSEEEYANTLALAKRITADLRAQEEQIVPDKTVVASHDETDDVKLVEQAITILRELLTREATDGESVYNLQDLVQILSILDWVKFKEQMEADEQTNEDSPVATAATEVTDGGDDMTIEEIVTAVTEANKPTMEAFAAIMVKQNELLASLVDATKTPVVEVATEETVAEVVVETEEVAVVAEAVAVVAEVEAATTEAVVEVATEEETVEEVAAVEETVAEFEVPAGIAAAAEKGEVVIAEVPEADSDGETTVYATADDDEDDPVVAMINGLSDTGRATALASDWLNIVKTNRINARDEDYKEDHRARVAKANRVPVGVQEDLRSQLGSDDFSNFALIFRK